MLSGVPRAQPLDSAEASRRPEIASSDTRHPAPSRVLTRSNGRSATHLRIDPPDEGVAARQSSAVEQTGGPSADWTADELAEFVCQNGWHFDSYLATEPGRLLFRSRSGQGLISYTRRGQYVLVGGGLIAPAEHKPQLLDDFVAFLRQARLRVAFHNMSEDELPLFRERGFQITKWGEEPMVDLEGLTFGGKAFEWVRRQSNFCLRHGMTCAEVRPETLEPEHWSRTLAEVIQVAAESLSAKAQAHEMTFFEGRIGEHVLGLRRLFVARSGHGAGRMEGFLICNPIQGGTLWSTELYRRRLDSVRGTMAFLFHQVLLQFQKEGVRSVALCLDPGYQCETPLPGDSALIRRGMVFGDRHLGMIFENAGIRHFKSRFRPRYEGRYVCALPRVSIGSVVAFLRVSGLFHINVRNLCRILWNRWFKRAKAGAPPEE